MIKQARREMSSMLSLIEPEVIMITHPNGDIVLQNKIPLAPYPQNMMSWLRQHAANFPNKPFLQQRNKSGRWEGVTYSETLVLVNRLSNGLVALGLDTQTPIAILSENCINMALIQLAAMQIGLPVVPISVAYSLRSQTGHQIEHILQVSRPQMLVTSDAALHLPKVNYERLPHVVAFQNHDVSPLPSPPKHVLRNEVLGGTKGGRVMPFSHLFALAPNQDTLNEAAQARFLAVTHDTLAKIQFTSGSTGKPKGVMITHGMMTSNQVAVTQLWPFLNSAGRVIDWLPWNHTFGGNAVFNQALMHGWSFYIDDGNPTPAGQERTIQNIIDIRPTAYFGVPRSYTALYARMQRDGRLKEAFFKELDFIFTAGAALDQATYQGMKAMSAEVRGEAVPFFSGWGCTESAPNATLVYSKVNDIRIVGVPIPGTSIKLTADPSGKQELCIKGPNVTPGYYNNPEATSAAPSSLGTCFDAEGYYHTGDAGKLKNPARPAEGLLFDGRIGENFKLSSGVWVQNAALRASINQLGQPYLLDLVVAAPNREYLTALIFPNLSTLRRRFTQRARCSQTSDEHPEDVTFLRSLAVRHFFRDIFRQHNGTQKGSSRRFERFIILSTPPQVDGKDGTLPAETTDKRYINQRAVLAHRADDVAKLYQEPPPSEVVIV